jgi:hypothetical protein
VQLALGRVWDVLYGCSGLRAACRISEVSLTCDSGNILIIAGIKYVVYMRAALHYVNNLSHAY